MIVAEQNNLDREQRELLDKIAANVYRPNHVQRNGLAYSLLIVCVFALAGAIASEQMSSELGQIVAGQGSLGLGALAVMVFGWWTYR